MSAFSQQLQALFDSDWAFELGDNPEFASQAGEHDFLVRYHQKASTGTGGTTPRRHLQDLSPSAYASRKAHSEAMVSKVEALLGSPEIVASLSKQEILFANIFKSIHADLSQAIDQCKTHLMPINSIGAGCVTYSFLESIEWMRFESVDDFILYQQRLLDLTNQVDDYIVAFREGLSKGYVASAAMTRNIESQLTDIIKSDLSDMYAPLRADSAATILTGTSLHADITAAIEGTRAAYQKFLDFFTAEYAPHVRQDPACKALPNGEAIYAACLRFHTTTNLTADEIHEIGVAEVARIEGRYRDDVLIPLGYDPDDFKGFVEEMKAKPEFYVNSSEKLLQVYRDTCAEIDSKLPDFFQEFPRSPLEITAKSAGPAAYYLAGTADGKRPGRFYVNTSHIEKRPLYETVALSLHEAIPGHHHQVSLGLENEAVPNFIRFIEDRRYEICPARRNLFAAYSEGWGLYSEFLGEEMGMYKTPYDIFGRLSMEMMRAVRLVVDTGIHAKGWSVEKCIAYMMEKTGMHYHEVDVEIYRYASWPGQACAYKIGQIEILRLRKRAEDALGAKFSLKAFHTICLTSGPMTLQILSDLIEEYIADTLKA